MTRPTLDEARATLREHFGFDAFRPGQERAVDAVLAGRDALVILPTGGGKSLCYQVPALLLPGLTVVVSPLISLMKDQVDALAARGLPAAFINSTLTANEIADRLARAQRGEIKLLYVAPERFDAGSTAERLRAMGVSLLAVDEAHCISEWGHDFRPSYLRVAEVREKLGDPPAIALTATATPEVRRDIVRQLRLRDPETIITGFDRRNLRFHVVPTRTERDKDGALIDILQSHDGQAIVYASTRRGVEKIAGVLQRARIRVAAYHAGLDDEHRHEVQDAFMGERVRVIVATNAFGMGIDKANVRLVVHHTMPGSLEAYYQEAGRAGRDGQMADCFLLHAFQDRFTHEFFVKGSYPERATVESIYAALQRASDRSGSVPDQPEAIVAMLRDKTHPREVESALRILQRAGALIADAGAASVVQIRLLATVERIRQELTTPHSLELGLLRALWRLHREALYEGVLVDLDGLPPGIGGAGAIRLLQGLEQRQFLTWERAGAGARLSRPRTPLAAFPFDWALLERRRKAELSKLDAMQRYAYATGCRRGFVLRYFGDAAAAPRCDGCDNCLGLRREPPANEGGRDGRGRSRKERAGDRPRRGRATLRPAVGTDDVLVPATPVVDEAEPSPADRALFDRLKALRSSIARDEQVPAYVVFPDRTLMELALRRPRTPHAMALVRGVGPAKLEKYGERFLAAIRDANETEAA